MNQVLLCIFLFFFGAACKNSYSGTSTDEGARMGASDALMKRDTDFRPRQCFCSFFLDHVEREPFTQNAAVTAGKAENCQFYSGTDGREEHRLDTLSVHVWSGASRQHMLDELSHAEKNLTAILSHLNQSLKKGQDTSIELRLGRTADRKLQKATVAYDDFTGRMIVVKETSLEVGADANPEDVFDEVGVRYIDNLFLNFQASCDALVEL